MIRRIALSVLSLTLAVAAITVTPVAHAAPRAGSEAKAKLVNVQVRNASKDALQLQMGDQQATVAPGATSAFKLPAGQRIVTVNATSRAAAGDTLCTVIPQMNGSTIVVN